jgi:hypothetical protein
VGLKGFDEAILSLINQCLGVEPLREDHAQTKCHNEVKKGTNGYLFLLSAMAGSCETQIMGSINKRQL